MANTKNDAQASLIEESKTPEKKQDSIPKEVKKAEPTIVVEGIAEEPKQDFYIFKLVKDRKTALHIDGTDDVINPVTKKMERIRLISGVSTIWMKEQKDLDKEYVERNMRSLIFNGKIMRVPAHDHTLLEFAKICRHNIGSPDRKSGSRNEFFEYNPMKAAKEAEDKEMLEINVIAEVSRLGDEELKELASYFRISFIGEYDMLKPIGQIRTDMIRAVKRNPEEVKKMLGSDTVTTQFRIKKAITDSRIDLGSTPGAALWATGGMISQIPPAKPPLEFLTELAMSATDEGRKFKEQLNNLK
jgi:hypothetical protein